MSSVVMSGADHAMGDGWRGQLGDRRAQRGPDIAKVARRAGGCLDRGGHAGSGQDVANEDAQPFRQRLVGRVAGEQVAGAGAEILDLTAVDGRGQYVPCREVAVQRGTADPVSRAMSSRNAAGPRSPKARSALARMASPLP